MTEEIGLAAVLERLAMSMVAVTTRAIAASGEELTFPQWRVLVVVAERDGGVPMSEVAARTGSSLSPASRLVRRMQTRGWIELTKGDHDRRVTMVRATAGGVALRDAVFVERRTFLAKAAHEVGALNGPEVALLTRIADEVARLA